MKHLKRFNEGFEPNEVEDLKDFCNNTLAYLLDDGFEVKFSKLEVEKDEYLNILEEPLQSLLQTVIMSKELHFLSFP
jgi:hypothetical protein